MLLALDPSITATGYAVFGATDDDLLEWGVNRPTIGWSRCRKIRWLLSELEKTLGEYDIEDVVVEVPSGKVAMKTAGSRGAGIAVYGEAVGVHEGWLLAQDGVALHRVDERQWTARSKKQTRALRVEARFPDYDRTIDRGLDGADAIGLGWWFLKHQEIRR